MRLIPCLLAACLALWLAVVTPATAVEMDARPAILVVGDVNAMGYGSTPAWPDLVGKQHPDWQVFTNAEDKRLLGDVAANLDAILAPYQHLEAVLIFQGTREAEAGNYAATDAAKLGLQMGDLLARLRANPKTAKAKLCVVTPAPVIDARLDKWSKDAFAGGEAHSDAIAAAYRDAAGKAGVPVIDFHAWEKADMDGDRPGKLMGSIGWRIRDWGIPMMTAWLEPQLREKVNPQPADPAAFAAWQREYQANRELDMLLARTSEGIVAHGEAFASTFGSDGKNTATKATIPAAALTGDSLDLLVMASTAPWAIVQPGSDRWLKPTLTVKVAGEEKEIALLSPADAWQIIDEATPDTQPDTTRYRFNMVTMRYPAVMRNEPGKRRWLLIRFPLADLAGKQPLGGVLTLNHFQANEFVDGQDKPLSGPAGETAVYPIVGLDTAWESGKATWRTRDGSIGWSGGTVNIAARKQALTEFLQQNPPKRVADRAQQELSKLR